MNIFEQFVGVPWADRGRELDGADCWGLIRLVYARHAVALPSYHEAYETATDRRTLKAMIDGTDHFGEWREVPADSEKPFDAVLILEGGEPCHVGLVADPTHRLMLHMVPQHSAVLERYDGRIAPRVAGFYRHEAFR